MKKKSTAVIGSALVLAIVIGGGSYYYFGVHQPHTEAVAEFDAAAAVAAESNKALDASITEAEDLLAAGAPPFNAATLKALEESTAQAKEARVVVPAMPDGTPEILAAAEELSAPIDLTPEQASLSSAMRSYVDSTRQLEQLTNPGKDFVLERLDDVPTISGAKAATEDNDPNGSLNKPGGYTAAGV